MRVTAYNPVRPYIGAPLGAMAGSLSGLLAFVAAIKVFKPGGYGGPVDKRRRTMGAISAVTTFGACLGAYLGAAPHQRVAAAVGAAVGGAGGLGTWMVAEPVDVNLSPPQRVALEVFYWSAPVAGAAAGAAVAGTGPAPAYVLPGVPRA